MREVLAKVALGEADAGFVYSTDAKTVSDKVKVIKVPAWAQPKVQYGICVVSKSSNKADAQAFINKVLSKAGQARLLPYGFLPRVKPRRSSRDEAGAACAPLRGRRGRRRWCSSRCRSSRSSPTPRPPTCSTNSRIRSCRDAFVVSLKTSLIAQAPDHGLRDADGVPPRDAAVPRARGRGDARRASPGPAAGGRGDRPARRVRPPRVARLDLRHARGRASVHAERRNVAVAYVASPLYIRQAIAAFEATDPNLTAASRTLGAGPARTFFRVSSRSPAAGSIAGLALSFARGLGEFGATIMFAGSLQRVTQTLPLAIYAEFDRELRRGAGDERRPRRRQRRCCSSASSRTHMAALTLEDIVVPLRSFDLRLTLEVDSTSRWSARRGGEVDRAPSGRRPGPARVGPDHVRRRGLVRRGGERLARTGPAARRPRLPGLRTVPAPDRSRRTSSTRGATAPTSTSSASRIRHLAASPTGRALRRRAPTGGTRTSARARPARCCCWTSRSPRSTRTPRRRSAPSCTSCSRGLGLPALLVTHDFEDAAALADRVGVIVDGELRQIGMPGRARRASRATRSSPRSPARTSCTGTAAVGGQSRTVRLEDGNGRRHRRRCRRRRRARRLPVGHHHLGGAAERLRHELICAPIRGIVELGNRAASPSVPSAPRSPLTRCTGSDLEGRADGLRIVQGHRHPRGRERPLDGRALPCPGSNLALTSWLRALALRSDAGRGVDRLCQREDLSESSSSCTFCCPPPARSSIAGRR